MRRVTLRVFETAEVNSITISGTKIDFGVPLNLPGGDKLVVEMISADVVVVDLVEQFPV